MSEKSSELASSHWNIHPCGTYQESSYILSYHDLLTLFNQKLQQQPWQKHYIPYNKFKHKPVLEIGTGVGFDLLRFASGGAICHGLDITDRHIANTYTTFSRYSFACDVRKEDISLHRSSFEDEYFDLIYSFGVIHHIESRSLMYSEVARMLKPNGRVIFVTYNLFSLATLSLYLHSIINLNIFRFGRSKVHSTIEAGVDIRSSFLPYVELKTKSFWEKEFKDNGFHVVSTSTHQVYFSRYKFLNIILYPLHPFLGWYNYFELNKL
jgi:2-polyprenyl-3-methyl-5-hydroxy-6-metoxy-1,4-benzoquinol methylase